MPVSELFPVLDEVTVSTFRPPLRHHCTDDSMRVIAFKISDAHKSVGCPSLYVLIILE